MPKQKKVTADQVLAWLGSDCTIEECADTLASIANGEYNPKDLRKEVSDYEQE